MVYLVIYNGDGSVFETHELHDGAEIPIARVRGNRTARVYAPEAAAVNAAKEAEAARLAAEAEQRAAKEAAKEAEVAAEAARTAADAKRASDLEAARGAIEEASTMASLRRAIVSYLELRDL